jgi:xylulose-5-phosphate/fructose-6-phosphate phosphoketolase
LLESWLRGYRPEELFDEKGRLVPELKALAPTGTRRMSANPIANGGLLRRPLDMPDFRDSPSRSRNPEQPWRAMFPPSATCCATSRG